MRNETLKNLLLTASLISASALLTACGDNAKDPAKPAIKPEGEQGRQDHQQPDPGLKEEEAELKAANENLDAAADTLGNTIKDELPPAPLPDAPAPSAPLSAFEKFSAEVGKLLPTEVKDGIVIYKKPASIAEPMEIGLRDLIRTPRGYAKTQELLAVKEKSLESAQKVYDKRQSELEALRAQQEKVLAAFDAVMSNGNTVEKAKARSVYLKVAPYIQEYEVVLMQANDVLNRAKGLIDKEKEYLVGAALNLTGNPDDVRPVEAADTLKTRVDALVFKAFYNFPKKLFEAASPAQFPIFLGRLNVQQVATFLKEDIDLFKTGNLVAVVDKLYTMLSTTLYHLLPAKPGEVLSDKETLAAYLASTISLTTDEKALIVGDLKAAIRDSFDFEGMNIFFKEFMPANDGSAEAAAIAAQAAGLSAGTLGDISGNVSFRQARTSATGSADLRAFNVNGAAGESIALGMPLFVQLKGDVSSSKATEAATGSVAYRLGSTVIGAIQGYANSGDGFGIEGRQFETSVVASHSFGSLFIEGQLGTVSATDVHSSNWKGMRSQVTLGLDTEFVSPFVQITHRQLDRSGLDLNQTTGFVGLDMDVAKLKADSYSVDARLTAKVGYGEKAWSVKAIDLGTTTGFSGSVEWAGSLNLNSGVKFTTNLGLDTVAGSSAAVNVSLDR